MWMMCCSSYLSLSKSPYSPCSSVRHAEPRWHPGGQGLCHRLWRHLVEGPFFQRPRQLRRRSCDRRGLLPLQELPMRGRDGVEYSFVYKKFGGKWKILVHHSSQRRLPPYHELRYPSLFRAPAAPDCGYWLAYARSFKTANAMWGSIQQGSRAWAATHSITSLRWDSPQS